MVYQSDFPEVLWDSKSVKRELEKRQSQLKRSIKSCQNAIKKSSDTLSGSLIQNINKGHPQYYLHMPNEGRRYLSKKDMPTIRKIAQLNYDIRFLETAQKKYAQIESFLSKMNQDEPESIFQNLDIYRKKLIAPRITDNEAGQQVWLSLPVSSKLSYETSGTNITNAGESVRSKSELIIADRLKKYNLSFKYENPLVLQDGTVIYPDFTIIHPQTLKVYYWEHFGMMDDLSYVESAVNKINSLFLNGINRGQLVTTYETKKQPLSTRIVEGLIKEYFLS